MFGERRPLPQPVRPAAGGVAGAAAGRRRRALPAGLGGRRGAGDRRARSTTRATIGTTIECAGPRVYTLRELVRAGRPLVGRVRGRCSPCPPRSPACRRCCMELLPGDAADVARQPRFDARRQRRQRQAARARTARHRADAARGDRAALPRPRRPARSASKPGARGRGAAERCAAPAAAMRRTHRRVAKAIKHAAPPRLASSSPIARGPIPCSSTSATRTTRPGRCGPGC